MSFAPIIVFVYNRADHFIRTYDALAKCAEAKESDLYIFSDGFKNEKSKQSVEEVRAVAHSIKNNGDFKSVTVVEAPQNMGLANSVINGVTKVINQYGAAIVVEDDCMCCSDFLAYMNRCLDFYKDKKYVGSVSGYVPQIDLPDDYRHDVFLANRSCSCTWGTWSDRWQGVDWELKDIGDFYKNPKLIKKLNSNGSDRFMRLYRQTKGNGSSWSVRFGAHLVKNGYLTLYPRYSYIQNIGCDESGVHSKSDDAEKMQVDLSKAIKNPVVEDISIDRRIQRIMKKHYSYGFISDFKRFMITCLIVITKRFKG